MTWPDVVDLAAKHWLTAIFGAVAAALTAGYHNLSKRIKRNREEDKSIQNGMKALLEDRLIQLCNHNQERGYCPVYARKSAEAMYNAYHGLGGNGTITMMYESLFRLPTEKREES